MTTDQTVRQKSFVVLKRLLGCFISGYDRGQRIVLDCR